MKIILPLTAMALATFSSLAGTVITNNLPPNTAIINISGTQDGAATYNGDLSLWYHPFYTGGATQILQYTFQPGTYSFRIVDPADAAQLFPALTSAQTNQIFTAWTFNTPCLTTYVAFDSAATNNFSIPQLFDGASGTNYGNSGIPLYGSYTAAYNAAITNGSYRLIRTGTNGYDSTNFTATYTFTNSETLVFAIPDYDLNDNGGGVSLLVAPVAAGLAVNWFKVAGGGGASSDGTLTIKGTAGQPDAGAMSDGTLTVHGGFWNVQVVQTPGLPNLTIQHSGNSTIVSWPNTGSYTLQQNANLALANGWTTSGYTITTANGTNSITINSPAGNLFFRLSKP